MRRWRVRTHRSDRTTSRQCGSSERDAGSGSRPARTRVAARFPWVHLAVLASGTGSILEALLEADIDVSLVVVDRPCRAVELASSHGVEAVVIARADFSAAFDRAAYSEAVVAELSRRDIDVVAMAGFGTVLAAPFFDRYAGRVLNTHPALLPSFPGWHGVRDALAHGVKITGCTVHLATLEVDAGPILAQAAVEVLPDDDESSLHERIKAVERRLYPATLRHFMDDLEVS